ncbi:MAG: fatty acid desaturase [Cyanobacteria bacterium HKST-UBA06]|nr:fatty acid desaturase [Cyanobacteria bacterium HKST-UBA06]
MGFITFTWSGLLVFTVMTYLTMCLGISMGFHRLHTHKSFKTSRGLTVLLALLGTLAIQGGPIRWVATHRLHHKTADQRSADPHSPKDGFWWAHAGWTVFMHPELTADRLGCYASDLIQDPVFRYLEENYAWLYTASLLMLGLGGFVYDGWPTAVSWVIWGGFVRTVYVWHITWLVNSATHRFGYTNYQCLDDSRNLWWLALLTSGEGWHNNHHAHPRAAKMGHRWFEFDLTYITLRIFQRLGLVKALIYPAKTDPCANRLVLAK